MKNKVLSLNLFDKRSIDRVIKEIRLQRNEISNKCSEFVRRLSEIGIPVIKQNIVSTIGDSDKNHNIYIKVNSFGSYSQATLYVEGRDMLFMEFGSGVYYNGSVGGSPHPKGKEFGYTIGSYGKGQGKNESWFYYTDSGEIAMSHGTKASMPVYKASIEIRTQILKIAREIFGK